MLLQLRHIPASLMLVSFSLSSCTMANPSWDPPAASAQTEGGAEEPGESADEGDHDSGMTGSPGSDDEIHHDGDGDGDGNGDGNGDGDTDEGDGDQSDGGGGGGGDGDGDAAPGCGEAAASFGSCPPICDECIDGICWRYCANGGCHESLLLCPVSWSCRFLCIGKDSCKKATFVCTGWGLCELECRGDNACTDVDILCAGGPCTVTCGAGHDKPCDKLNVICGNNVTKLHCEEPHAGAGPSLSKFGQSKCQCTSDCVPK